MVRFTGWDDGGASKKQGKKELGVSEAKKRLNFKEEKAANVSSIKVPGVRHKD